eukprot:gene9858-20503_t
MLTHTKRDDTPTNSNADNRWRRKPAGSERIWLNHWSFSHFAEMAKKLPALSEKHASVIKRTMLQWGRAMAPVLRLLWSVNQQARPDMTVEDVEAGDNEPEEDMEIIIREITAQQTEGQKVLQSTRLTSPVSKRRRNGRTGSGNE